MHSVKHFALVLAGSSLLLSGCTSQPTVATAAGGLATVAWQHYENRDFESAIAAYDRAIANARNNDEQFLALVGLTHAYLTTDPKWRNLDKARETVDRVTVLAGAMPNSDIINMQVSTLRQLVTAEAENRSLMKRVRGLRRTLSEKANDVVVTETAELALTDEDETEALMAQLRNKDNEIEQLKVTLEKLRKLSLKR